MNNQRPKVRKVISRDLLPLIYNYLISIGLESVAKKLQKTSHFDLADSDTPLAQKKLQKIAKFYVTNHKHMIKKFIVQPESEEEEEEEEEEQIIKIKKSKINGNGKKSQVVEEVDEEEEDEDKKVPQKNSNLNQKRKKSQEEVESEEEEKPKKQKKIKKQEVEEGQVVANEVEEEQNQDLQPGERKYFQKCDDRRLQFIKTELKDNSHEAKKKFGHGDTFGDEGYDKLKVVQGKGFRKQKDKLKNKGFAGGNGNINTNQINSIPL